MTEAKKRDEVIIPQAPNLARVRKVLERIAAGTLKTAVISRETDISTRHVNYCRQALVALGLATTRDGPATPAGKKLLRTKVDSEGERQAFREAIATSPLTQALGIDVVSFQPPNLAHLAARCRQLYTGSSKTLDHRFGDVLSWRRQLGIDVEPQVLKPESPQLSLELQSSIPSDLARNLRGANPWWTGHAMKPVPPFRRSFLTQVEEALRYARTPVVAVRGPRQVGKTTAHDQLIKDLLRSKVPPTHILRAQFDELPSLVGIGEPILRIVEWYQQEVLSKTLNDVAADSGPVYILLDEVQNVENWAIQLKHLVDNAQVHVLVTGSSALQLEEGADSLAGRILTIDVGTLTLSEVAQVRHGKTLPTMLGDSSNLSMLADREFWTDLISQGAKHQNVRDEAFRSFSKFGGYPLAHTNSGASWDLIAAQLNETVVRRVIAHDLQTSVRALELDLSIEEVFRLCCRYAGQTPTLNQLAKVLRNNGGGEVSVDGVREALMLFERALLVRLVSPLEVRLKKNRGPSKLCLIDHALRASWFGEHIQLDPAELKTHGGGDVVGHIVESIVGTHLLGIRGMSLTHFPRRQDDLEVDFVITAGAKRIPVEVKYRGQPKIDDFEGLQQFVAQRNNNAPFGIMVAQREMEGAPDNVIVVPLPTFLMLH